MREFSNVLNTSGVNLESVAASQFGVAGQTGVDRSLAETFRLPQDQQAPPGGASQIESNVWDSTRYAAQKASRAMGSMVDSAKLKFLFKVSFAFNPQLIEYAASVAGVDLSELSRSLDFTVKQVDLPKFEYDYEEVNLYNFRSKVLKQIRHREINLTFYDDVGNKAIDFINVYRMMHQPIARREQSASSNLQDYGFSFDDNISTLNSSLRGPLQNNAKNILSLITIHQYYMDLGSGEPVKVNDYVCVNPRLTNIDINDQDHEIGGSPNFVSVIFDFDGLFIETGQSAAPDTHSRTPAARMTHDILSDYDVGQAQIYRGAQAPAGGNGNQFADITGQQSGGPGQLNLQESMLRMPNTSQAGGGFGNNFVGTPTSAASFASKEGMRAGTVQALARPTVSPLSDNSTPSSRIPNLTSRTRSTSF